MMYESMEWEWITIAVDSIVYNHGSCKIGKVSAKEYATRPSAACLLHTLVQHG